MFEFIYQWWCFWFAKTKCECFWFSGENCIRTGICIVQHLWLWKRGMYCMLQFPFQNRLTSNSNQTVIFTSNFFFFFCYFIKRFSLYIYYKNRLSVYRLPAPLNTTTKYFDDFTSIFICGIFYLLSLIAIYWCSFIIIWCERLHCPFWTDSI